MNNIIIILLVLLPAVLPVLLLALLPTVLACIVAYSVAMHLEILTMHTESNIMYLMSTHPICYSATLNATQQR